MHPARQERVVRAKCVQKPLGGKKMRKRIFLRIEIEGGSGRKRLFGGEQKTVHPRTENCSLTNKFPHVGELVTRLMGERIANPSWGRADWYPIASGIIDQSKVEGMAPESRVRNVAFLAEDTHSSSRPFTKAET
jgi:hypothetical protein